VWRRLERVIGPPQLGGWASSHASVPFLDTASQGLRLFYSTRDESGRSHTGRSTLELSADGASATLLQRPVLSPGSLGGFDDCGAMGSCLVHHEGRVYLYYIGWSQAVTVPFATYIGLAISDDGGETFERAARGPVIGRSDADPFLATSPYVLVEGGRWRMWYASGERWEQTADGPKHHYRIVYAESGDGVSWEPSGRVCIDYADEREYAIARPSVLCDAGRYRMWFSRRGTAYSIGYAESADGLTWVRDDERAGLRPSGTGWDSRSVEYCYVFDHEEARWMLYNGNDYGATGIGLARWEEGS
jgi:hypothetical protein